jgi:hypothetical protein
MTEPSKQLSMPNVPEAPSGIVAMMERLALNPDLPVDKLEKLLDMQIKIMGIEAEKEFAAAMARVQATLPKVKRDRTNDQTSSKYSTIEAIAAAIKPIYTAEGFSMSFSEAPSPKENHVRVVGILRHKHGHKTEHYRDVAIDATGIAGKVNKTQTHAEASSITYGRRYVTCLAFDVATGDDTDGNKPGDKINEEQAARLRDMMYEFKVEEPKFLEALQLEKLEDMPASSFSAARVALKARAKASREAAK